MKPCSCTAIGTVYPAGDYTFSWDTLNIGNVTDLTIKITDLETGVVLITNGSKTSPITVHIPYDITRNTPGDYKFSIEAEGTCGPVKVLDEAVVKFCVILKIYHEGNTKPNLTATEIPAELSFTETTRYPGDYNAFGKGYKYIAVPQTLMETDGSGNSRPTNKYVPAKLRSDIGHNDETFTEVDTTTSFNPMFAMEDPYVVNILGENYNVFRSTYLMDDSKHITLFDWN
jgi:hypothetical protein